MVTASKLAAFGMTGLKAGDRLTLTVVTPMSQYKVTNPRSHLEIDLDVTDKGVIKLHPAASAPGTKRGG